MSETSGTCVNITKPPSVDTKPGVPGPLRPEPPLCRFFLEGNSSCISPVPVPVREPEGRRVTCPPRSCCCHCHLQGPRLEGNRKEEGGSERTDAHTFPVSPRTEVSRRLQAILTVDPRPHLAFTLLWVMFETRSCFQS